MSVIKESDATQPVRRGRRQRRPGTADLARPRPGLPEGPQVWCGQAFPASVGRGSTIKTPELKLKTQTQIVNP